MQRPDNTAPSATRFPRLEVGNGKHLRLRVPRPTLRWVAARIRVFKRLEERLDGLLKGREYNRYRVERLKLEGYVRDFLNGALKQQRAA